MMVVELEMELLDREREKKKEKRKKKCERLYEMIEELMGKSFRVEFGNKEGGGWKVEGIRSALEGAGVYGATESKCCHS